MRFTNKMNRLATALAASLLVAISAQAATSRITNMTIANDNVVDGQKLDITISGDGKACNYYLTIINTDTQQEWPLPKISAFPAQDRISMELANPNYPHGNYKFTAKARPNDTRPGESCQGGGNYIAFKKTRAVIKVAADTPKIVDVLIEPGKKMGGTDRFRSDETIRFNVVGSVENTSANDVTNRCGWTAQLVDKNGIAKDIGKDSRFGVWQSSMSLAGVGTGDYTLTIKTTAADDALAKQPCLGKATKKVAVFGAPGVIKGVDLESMGNTILTSDTGVLFITPRITGPQCMYTVTRKINGKNTMPTLQVHMPDGDFKERGGKMLGENFPDDETLVEITIQGMNTNYFEGGSCEGSATKSITVYDKNGKKGVVH
ncbi:MAG: hypothetical protein LH481_17770 [Burkholderiales bacterium]|nr:hypothetical protein [Burkholderiales bacterium]